MKKINIILLTLLLNGCNTSYNSSLISNNNSNITISNSKNYSNYSEYHINLDNIYDMNNNEYVVYFYSYTCPACYSLKDKLFNYLNLNNKPYEIYLVNIFETDDDTFNKMLMDDSISKEEAISLSIGATNLENTYFIHTPSLYFINKINKINTLTNIYINYQDIENMFINNK